MTILNARSDVAGYDQRVEAFGPLGPVSTQSNSYAGYSGPRSSSGARDPFLAHLAGRYRKAYR